MDTLPPQLLERFSKAVGSIYDCALDPQNWDLAIKQIAALTNSSMIGLHFASLPVVRGVMAFTLGFEEPYKTTINTTYGPMWALMSGMAHWPEGQVFKLEDVVDREEYYRSRHYREWVAPQRAGDVVTMVALRSRTCFVLNSNNRYDWDDEYSDLDMQVFRLLAPHITRSLRISDALSLKTVTSNALEATLEKLTAGVMLVGDDRKLLYVNAAGERILARSTALTLVDHRLVARDAKTSGRLDEILANMIAHQDSEPTGHTLAIPEPGGSGLIATILPIASNANRNILAPFTPAAAVFVQDPGDAPAPPTNALAELYGLTSAETRVLMSLAQGFDPAGVSDLLGIAMPTVRTHIQRLLEKTGTSRQADLLALIARSAVPVSPPR